MRGSRGALAAMLVAGTMLAGAGTASAAKITIKPSNDEQLFGSAGISIGGKLTPDSGTAPEGHEVTLTEKRYPYKRARKVGSATTVKNGKYRFRGIKPQFNTRYQVSVSAPGAAARSKSELVVVFPRSFLDARVPQPDHVAATFGLTYSAELPLDLSGNKVLWYFVKKGNKTFKVIDKSRAKQRGGRVRARTEFDIPHGTYRFFVSACVAVPDRRDIGIGHPGTDNDCPRKFPARTGRVARASTGALPLPIATPGPR